MANTLKFGNGVWANKEGSTLAYNDENGNFKPLPFDFTRATSATRVNKQGLIETVGVNQPRVDFSNDTNGALLLEPSRTNLNTFSDPTDAQKGSTSYASVTYQDDFYWGLGNVINNAIVFGDNSTTRYAYYSSTVSSGTVYSLSFFIKMDDNSVPIPATDFLLVLAGTSIASGYTIDNYGNNVYRVSVSGTAGASNTANGILKIASHSAKTFKITGFQIEAASYATSYIPTSGSVVTRVAETANGAGNSTVFNDSEGVLFAEIAAFSDDSPESAIAMGDGTYDDRVIIYTYNNYIYAFVFVGGINVFSIGTTEYNVKEFNKIALKYKSGDYSIYINGFEKNSSTSVITPSGIDRLNFNDSVSGLKFYGKTKQIQYFNTALTDAELQALTTL